MIEWLRRQMIPVARLVGRIAAPWSVKKITGLDYERAKFLIQPGDILVARTLGHLTNLFIPGYWKHAGIMGPHGTVIEAIGSGVVETDLVSFMTSKDEVAILRPSFCSEAERFNASATARAYLGSHYDFEFSLGNKAFYCAELVYSAYKSVVPSWDFSPRLRLGVFTVTADDFFQAKKWWQPVYDSRAVDGSV